MSKSAPWKDFERKIAKRFNGKRVVRADFSVMDLDVVAEPFGIECKYKKDLSPDVALEEAEFIIENKEERKHLLPIAVIQRVGTKGKEEAVFRLKLLVQLGIIDITLPEIAEVIIVVPLGRFLDILNRGSISYGKQGSVITSSRK